MSGLGRGLRQAARDLLPPVVVKAMRRARRAKIPERFVGDYRSYAEALQAAGSAGYEDPGVIASMLQQTRDYRTHAETRPQAVRDSRTFQNLTAFFVTLNGAPRTSLRVLDYGGGAGHHYFSLLPFLSRRGPLIWTVCEVPAMVRAASAAFSSPTLRFIESLESLNAGERFDVAFASGSLQYAPDPAALWKSIAARSDVAIINRAPFTSAAADRLTVQTVQLRDRVTRYPAWFLSESAWLRRFAESGFEVALRWSVPEDVVHLEGAELRYAGLAVHRPNLDALS
jgi:putative methyltransferase (TIGR04325 family)